MSETIPKIRGPSRDGRTNRWSVECPACGHIFEPQTTMVSKQYIICPSRKCGKELFARYNDEPPRVTLIGETTK